MSTSTIEQRLATDALEAEVTWREQRWQHVETIRHENGSVTLIEQEEYVEEWMSPRHDVDGLVAKLVMEHRDYVDLDEGDSGIEEARERWGDGDGYAHIEWNGRRLPLSSDEMVGRYLSIFRPDVAYYEPRWEVSGSAQGDWAHGYGYVLWSDLEHAGLTPEYMAERDMTPAKCFEEERRVYELYFSGEVYYAMNLRVGEPIVTYGPEGAYISGYVVDEDSCGGFLGYESYDEIAQQFTDSPAR